MVWPNEKKCVLPIERTGKTNAQRTEHGGLLGNFVSVLPTFVQAFAK